MVTSYYFSRTKTNKHNRYVRTYYPPSHHDRGMNSFHIIPSLSEKNAPKPHACKSSIQYIYLYSISNARNNDDEHDRPYVHPPSHHDQIFILPILVRKRIPKTIQSIHILHIYIVHIKQTNKQKKG